MIACVADRWLLRLILLLRLRLILLLLLLLRLRLILLLLRLILRLLLLAGRPPTLCRSTAPAETKGTLSTCGHPGHNFWCDAGQKK